MEKAHERQNSILDGFLFGRRMWHYLNKHNPYNTHTRIRVQHKFLSNSIKLRLLSFCSVGLLQSTLFFLRLYFGIFSALFLSVSISIPVDFHVLGLFLSDCKIFNFKRKLPPNANRGALQISAFKSLTHHLPPSIFFLQDHRTLPPVSPGPSTRNFFFYNSRKINMI